MKNPLIFIGMMVIAAILNATAQTATITSPTGKLSLDIHADKDNCSPVTLTLSSGETKLMDGIGLGLTTSRRTFSDLRLAKAGKIHKNRTDYHMPHGKRLHCTSRSNDCRCSFLNATGDTLHIDFRLSDDGLAFRYILDNGAAGETINSEQTVYPIADGTKRWIASYDIGYERFFPLATDGQDIRKSQNGRWGYPALIEPAKDLYILLTESDIQRHHCGSWLSNEADRQQYRVVYADATQTAQDTWTSPWRVLIAGSLSTIVESTLVTDVATPAVTKQTDWIKPAPVSWIYWAYNHGSRELSLIKDYIDLAADMHWPYMLIDAEWDEMTNGNTVEEALDYANKRGVKPMLWYNSCTGWIDGAPGPKWRLNKPEDRRKEFQWLHDHGVAGIKVDFFNGDGQTDMDYYHDILSDALDYRLMVVLHGAVAPRGLQRTYPNLMTMEGVYGAEWYNNNGTMTSRAACHNATLPFTRNVIGSMDYTPGTFTDSQHPHITTHSHELALTILFESALQHMPDRPSSYRSLPEAVRHLLSSLPTFWDETRLLDGYPGHHVVMARRSGNTWYIAGINGTDEPLTLTADLSLLFSGKRKATLFADNEKQQEFQITQTTIKSGKLPIKCLPRGGFVIRIKK